MMTWKRVNCWNKHKFICKRPSKQDKRNKPLFQERFKNLNLQTGKRIEEYELNHNLPNKNPSTEDSETFKEKKGNKMNADDMLENEWNSEKKLKKLSKTINRNIKSSDFIKNGIRLFALLSNRSEGIVRSKKPPKPKVIITKPFEQNPPVVPPIHENDRDDLETSEGNDYPVSTEAAHNLALQNLVYQQLLALKHQPSIHVVQEQPVLQKPTTAEISYHPSKFPTFTNVGTNLPSTNLIGEETLRPVPIGHQTASNNLVVGGVPHITQDDTMSTNTTHSSNSNSLPSSQTVGALEGLANMVNNINKVENPAPSVTVPFSMSQDPDALLKNPPKSSKSGQIGSTLADQLVQKLAPEFAKDYAEESHPDTRLVEQICGKFCGDTISKMPIQNPSELGQVCGKSCAKMILSMSPTEFFHVLNLFRTDNNDVDKYHQAKELAVDTLKLILSSIPETQCLFSKVTGCVSEKPFIPNNLPYLPPSSIPQQTSRAPNDDPTLIPKLPSFPSLSNLNTLPTTPVAPSPENTGIPQKNILSNYSFPVPSLPKEPVLADNFPQNSPAITNSMPPKLPTMDQSIPLPPTPTSKPPLPVGKNIQRSPMATGNPPQVNVPVQNEISSSTGSNRPTQNHLQSSTGNVAASQNIVSDVLNSTTNGILNADTPIQKSDFHELGTFPKPKEVAINKTSQDVASSIVSKISSLNPSNGTDSIPRIQNVNNHDLISAFTSEISPSISEQTSSHILSTSINLGHKERSQQLQMKMIPLGTSERTSAEPVFSPPNPVHVTDISPATHINSPVHNYHDISEFHTLLQQPTYATTSYVNPTELGAHSYITREKEKSAGRVIPFYDMQQSEKRLSDEIESLQNPKENSLIGALNELSAMRKIETSHMNNIMLSDNCFHETPNPVMQAKVTGVAAVACPNHPPIADTNNINSRNDYINTQKQMQLDTVVSNALSRPIEKVLPLENSNVVTGSNQVQLQALNTGRPQLYNMGFSQNNPLNSAVYSDSRHIQNHINTFTNQPVSANRVSARPNVSTYLNKNTQTETFPYHPNNRIQMQNQNSNLAPGPISNTLTQVPVDNMVVHFNHHPHHGESPPWVWQHNPATHGVHYEGESAPYEPLNAYKGRLTGNSVITADINQRAKTNLKSNEENSKEKELGVSNKELNQTVSTKNIYKENGLVPIKVLPDKAYKNPGNKINQVKEKYSKQSTDEILNDLAAYKDAANNLKDAIKEKVLSTKVDTRHRTLMDVINTELINTELTNGLSKSNATSAGNKVYTVDINSNYSPVVVSKIISDSEDHKGQEKPQEAEISKRNEIPSNYPLLLTQIKNGDQMYPSQRFWTTRRSNNVKNQSKSKSRNFQKSNTNSSQKTRHKSTASLPFFYAMNLVSGIDTQKKFFGEQLDLHIEAVPTQSQNVKQTLELGHVTNTATQVPVDNMVVHLQHHPHHGSSPPWVWQHNPATHGVHYEGEGAPYEPLNPYKGRLKGSSVVTADAHGRGTTKLKNKSKKKEVTKIDFRNRVTYGLDLKERNILNQENNLKQIKEKQFQISKIKNMKSQNVTQNYHKETKKKVHKEVLANFKKRDLPRSLSQKPGGLHVHNVMLGDGCFHEAAKPITQTVITATVTPGCTNQNSIQANQFNTASHPQATLPKVDTQQQHPKVINSLYQCCKQTATVPENSQHLMSSVHTQQQNHPPNTVVYNDSSHREDHINTISNQQISSNTLNNLQTYHKFMRLHPEDLTTVAIPYNSINESTHLQGKEYPNKNLTNSFFGKGFKGRNIKKKLKKNSSNSTVKSFNINSHKEVKKYTFKPSHVIKMSNPSKKHIVLSSIPSTFKHQNISINTATKQRTVQDAAANAANPFFFQFDNHKSISGKKAALIRESKPNRGVNVINRRQPGLSNPFVVRDDIPEIVFLKNAGETLVKNENEKENNLQKKSLNNQDLVLNDMKNIDKTMNEIRELLEGYSDKKDTMTSEMQHLPEIEANVASIRINTIDNENKSLPKDKIKMTNKNKGNMETNKRKRVVEVVQTSDDSFSQRSYSRKNDVTSAPLFVPLSMSLIRYNVTQTENYVKRSTPPRYIPTAVSIGKEKNYGNHVYVKLNAHNQNSEAFTQTKNGQTLPLAGKNLTGVVQDLIPPLRTNENSKIVDYYDQNNDISKTENIMPNTQKRKTSSNESRKEKLKKLRWLNSKIREYKKKIRTFNYNKFNLNNINNYNISIYNIDGISDDIGKNFPDSEDDQVNKNINAKIIYGINKITRNVARNVEAIPKKSLFEKFIPRDTNNLDSKLDTSSGVGAPTTFSFKKYDPPVHISTYPEDVSGFDHYLNSNDREN